MTGDILHELPGTSFVVWEAPKTRRQPRFKVIECGAGRRGTGRPRGTARTLAEADALAASLTPSTPAEILASIPVSNAADRATIAKLLSIAEPGTKLWVIRDGYGYEAVSEGLAVSGIEALFGDEIYCWLIRWRDPAGDECEGLYAVPLEDAERAWWVLSADGRVVAGGPPIYDRELVLEIAAEYGGSAVQGIASLPREVPGKAA